MGHVELLERRGRIAAAHDRGGAALAGDLRERPGHGQGAVGEVGPLEDAHGAVPYDRAAGAQHAHWQSGLG